MSETPPNPLSDLAAQVRPLIQALPARVQPRLMAELELAAAGRYDAWAAQCADAVQANGLRECAEREALALCAELEERSAAFLERLVAQAGAVE